MKNFEKFIVVLLLFLFINIEIVSSSWEETKTRPALTSEGCGGDFDCYIQSLNYSRELGTYINYYYNGKYYKIVVPSTITGLRFKYNLYLDGQLEKADYYYKSCQLNEALKNNNLEPLFY